MTKEKILHHAELLIQYLERTNQVYRKIKVVSPNWISPAIEKKIYTTYLVDSS